MSLKNLYILVLLLIAPICQLISDDISVNWNNTFKGNIINIHHEADNNGNVLVAGCFSDYFSYNKIEYYSQNGSGVFIFKINSTGKLLWDKVYDQTSSVEDSLSFEKMAIDSSGNVFLFIEIDGKIELPDTIIEGKYNQLPSNFILRINPNGEYVSAKVFPNFKILDFQVSPSSDLFVLGGFYDTLVLSENVKFEKIKGDRYSYFFSRYDSEMNIKWARNPIKRVDNLSSIAVDKDNNYYFSGAGGNVQIDSVILNSTSSFEIFAFKLDSDGIAILGINGGCVGVTGNDSSRIIIGENGSFYLAGLLNMYGSVGSSGWFNNIPYWTWGRRNIGIAKYNESGVCEWVRLIEGKKAKSIVDIGTNINDGIFIAANFSDSVYLERELQYLTNEPYLNNANILIDYSGDSSIIFSGAVLFDDFHKIHSISNNNNQYVVLGELSGSMKFENYIQSSNENRIYYLISYSKEPNSINSSYNDNEANITPNPAGDYIEINIDNHILQGMVGNTGGTDHALKDVVENVKIYNVLGELVISDVQHLGDVGHLIRIDVSGLPAGVYFVRVGEQMLKFVKL